MFQRICPECGREIDRQENDCACAQPASEPETAPLLALPAIEPRALFAAPPLRYEGPILPEPLAPILPSAKTCLAVPEPRIAHLADYSARVLAETQPADGGIRPAHFLSSEQTNLPAPVIPLHTQSFATLEISMAEISTALAKPEALPRPTARQASWVLSLAIGAGIVAVTLGGAFYAMPTLAGARTSPDPSIKQAKTVEIPSVAAAEASSPPPEHPLAAAVEVTGIRFVTDIPNQHPQLHYLVVNHSKQPIVGLTVTVSLRSNDGKTPVSQFSFRVPRLEAYESKEMINAIDHLSQPGATPDWRQTRIELALGSISER